MENAHRIIPEQEEQCVWMDAGLVDYKLCANGFECEHCPFDSVMHMQHRSFAQRASNETKPFVSAFASFHRHPEWEELDTLERLIAPFRAMQIPQDRIYLRPHTWMMRMNDDTIRVGIDEFLAHLLHPVSAVALVNVPSRINHGEPFAWFIRNGATYAVHNDISGTTVASNPQLAQYPSLITDDPYNEGWLLTLSGSCINNPQLKYLAPQEYGIVRKKETDQLSEFIRSSTRYSSGVAATMYDGGSRVENIEQFIGEKYYNSILSRLLSPH